MHSIRNLAFATLTLALFDASLGITQQTTEPGSSKTDVSAPIDPGFCIIRPDEPASIDIVETYNDRQYYFCCESCRTDFLSDPSRFEGLPTTSESSGKTRTLKDLPSYAYATTFQGRVGRCVLYMQGIFNGVSQALTLQDPVSASLAAFTAIWFMILGWLWRPVPAPNRRWRPSLGNAGLFSLLLVPCFYADSLRHKLVDAQHLRETLKEKQTALKIENVLNHDRDLIHYATFLNHGNPPIPRPSQLPSGLQKTYYRGNDERSTDMTNGGNYRTVTFDLWLENIQGKRIIPDSSVQPESELFLVIQFIRSPDTSDGYFTETYMQRMYLTMQSGDFLGRDSPIIDRVQWKMTQKNQVWVARFPLPEGVLQKEKRISGSPPKLTRQIHPPNPADRSGIVYLCEDRHWTTKMIGGRFHYAVQYELRTHRGVVLPTADLWMQATYRGRNFADLQIEEEEWLSSEPLPEK